MAIIDDYRRLYRLNIAQGFVDTDKGNGPLYFAQVMGTFFWPDLVS